MRETDTLESVRRSIEALDHGIGSLYDRLDRFVESEESRREVWRRLREYEFLLEAQKEQYLIVITAARRDCPESVAEWVAEHVSRLDRASERAAELTSSSLEATTLAFVIGRLRERWLAVAAGDDEPVIEHPTLGRLP